MYIIQYNKDLFIHSFIVEKKKLFGVLSGLSVHLGKVCMNTNLFL